MIQVSGRWHFHTALKELKVIDPTCGVETTFVDIEGIREGSIRVINYDLMRENDLRAALDSHDADAALAEWKAKQDRKANAEPAIRNIPGWATWTVQEAADWHTQNITNNIDSISNLNEAKILLRKLADENEKIIKMICLLRDHAGIV